MTSTPSPRSTPAPRSAEASPRSGPAPTSAGTSTLPDRSIPSWALDGASSDAKPAFVPAWRRPTLNTAGGSDAARRPSVQFVPHANKNTGSRSSSAHAVHRDTRRATHAGHAASIVTNGSGGRRMSSPPPPAQFRPSVSFDTFANKEASGDFSLTLNRKHRDFEWTKRSRTFLVGTDTNEYSDTALEWLIDELVDDGDEVVCLRVVEKDSREAQRWSGGQGEKGYRMEAERFLEAIEKKNTDDRSISLVLEFSIGKVQDAIQTMIKIYEPAMLVVGTRGRSLTGYQGLLSSGSVSKYCLQYSPVPVIVVRPSSKRESKKRKRLQDPDRRGYRDILDKSEDVAAGAGGVRGRGGHLLDERNRMSIMGSDLGVLGQLTPSGDGEDEARRVAEAIGYRDQHRGSSDARGSSLSRITSASSARSQEDLGSPDERLLQSPDLGAADSEMGSDEEDYSDDDLQENLRPEDEALQLAYERANKVVQEEKEEEEARRQREEERKAGKGAKRAGRSTSRGRGAEDSATGSNVLGLLAQLDRGMK